MSICKLSSVWPILVMIPLVEIREDTFISKDQMNQEGPALEVINKGFGSLESWKRLARPLQCLAYLRMAGI